MNYPIDPHDRRAHCEGQIEACDALLKMNPNQSIYVEFRRFWARLAYKLTAQMERDGVPLPIGARVRIKTNLHQNDRGIVIDYLNDDPDWPVVLFTNDPDAHAYAAWELERVGR